MINMIESDKENTYQLKTKSITINKNVETSKHGVIKKKSSSRVFGNLLNEVTNEMKMEEDSNLAKHIHKEEASSIAVEWVQEACDARLAKKYAKDEYEKQKAEKQHKIKEGEKTALQVALEERRIVKQKAEDKKRIETEDIEYAKKTVLDDINDTITRENECAKDVEYAKNMVNIIQDEFYAEDLNHQESLKYKKYKESLEAQSKKDELIAQSLYADFKKQDDKIQSSRIIREQADELYAKAIHSKMEFENRYDKESKASADFELARKEQIKSIRQDMEQKIAAERADAALAKKLSTKIEREEHRSKAAKILKSSGKSFRTAAQVRKQWHEAEAKIEDVSRGICITILLPFMRDLKVNVGHSQNVEIEARRLMAPDENIDDDDDSAFYIAEFLIDGAKAKITENCMSYEYASETGLLHVYVDNVHLEKAQDGKEREGILSKFKSGFSRMFGKNSRGKESK